MKFNDKEVSTIKLALNIAIEHAENDIKIDPITDINDVRIEGLRELIDFRKGLRIKESFERMGKCIAEEFSKPSRVLNSNTMTDAEKVKALQAINASNSNTTNSNTTHCKSVGPNKSFGSGILGE